MTRNLASLRDILQRQPSSRLATRTFARPGDHLLSRCDGARPHVFLSRHAHGTSCGIIAGLPDGDVEEQAVVSKHEMGTTRAEGQLSDSLEISLEERHRRGSESRYFNLSLDATIVTAFETPVGYTTSSANL